jgi:hypothetical protein
MFDMDLSFRECAQSFIRAATGRNGALRKAQGVNAAIFGLDQHLGVIEDIAFLLA